MYEYFVWLTESWIIGRFACKQFVKRCHSGISCENIVVHVDRWDYEKYLNNDIVLQNFYLHIQGSLEESLNVYGIVSRQ